MKEIYELNEESKLVSIGGICKAKDFAKQITKIKNNMGSKK
jgi:hypothetical protein